ncbi:NrtR DNA-binding winged helix domain-containing protein [Streptomyces sp. NPDC053079]|uniref:NUDIX hydrolase n=1 Tax=Streptomyces sp. NPDC053079 TaxID=3365697 RepID=UPI0037D3501D
MRELWEEAGVDGGRLHLEQLGAYGDPRRDPRGRVVTIAYLALGPDLPVPVGGTDARCAYWAPVSELADGTKELAFDHSVILADALEEIRRKLEYTAVATVFCGDSFTLSELRAVYEVIWGQCLDPSNFRRTVLNTAEFVQPTGERRLPPTGRPAALYRRGSAWLLSPPLLRGAGHLA